MIRFLFVGTNVLTPYALANSKDNRIFLDSVESSIAWHKPRHDKEQECLDFLSGRHRTPEEEEAYRKKNKTPVTFNFLKPQERSVLGTFLTGKFDVGWIPWGSSKSDEYVAMMEALRIWESKKQGDETLDVDSYGLSWVARTAFQEISMEYEPGVLPVMSTRQLNRFAVYPDPESRDIIRRRDAKHIDIRSFLSIDELILAFPDRKDWLLEKDRQCQATAANQASSYEQFTVSVDRDHETRGIRNGRYCVSERYYRMNRDLLSEGQRGPSISPFTGRPICDKGVKHKEELWYAVAVKEFGEEFVFNGRYHLQTIDPRDGTIVWPIIEYVFGAVNGEPQGAVEFQIDPAKAIDSLMANILHSAKHASSQALLIDPEAFVSEAEAKNAAMFHADADRSFRVKPGKLKEATAPIEHSQVTSDIYTGLDYAKRASDEIGTATPSLQGQKQGNESGVLYQQRIEQSQIQLAPSIELFRKSLEMKYLVRYILQRQYYTWEMIVPVIQPTEKQRKEGVEEIVLNQRVPKKDPYGFEIEGQVDIMNRPDAMLYCVTVAPSQRSQSHRLKTSAQLAEIASNPAAANDPVLGSVILEAQIDLSDLDPKYKDEIAKRREEVKQSEAAVQQGAAAEAQAATMKAESAMTMAQAQAQLAEATGNSLMVEADVKTRKIAVEEQKAQAQIQQIGSQVQQGEARLTLDAQKMGTDIQMKAQEAETSTQMQQIELAKMNQTMAFEREKMAHELKMKELDLEIKRLELQRKETEDIERSFAPVGVED